ncbi:MAG: hypothetical protein QOD86_2688, partial [Miltoncostaeaceae bacterium]|nr:hypothetical protein [Miltoncostaeaceae bacterium]
MNLLLDLRGIQTPYFPERGIARYVANHAAALADRPEVTRLVGVLEPDRPLPAVAPRFAERDGLVSWRRVNDALRGEGPFVYHLGSPFELDWTAAQLVPAAVRRPDVLRSVTLFDVIPMVYPDAHPGWLMRRWRYRAELIRSADLVLAISAFTAEDAIERLGLDPRRVRVIGTGVPGVDPATLAGPRVPPAIAGLEPRFVLYTGGSEHPRKNLPLLVRAFARLPEALRATHQLVIATRVQEPVRALLQDEADRAGVGGRLLMPGYVTDDELRGLYLSCRCFVYPSLYEGFGLPPVEAMSHGAPTVASGTTSVAEVIADPRAAFDPEDEGAVAAAMERVLEDPALAADLAARGLEMAARHTWAAVAERTVEAFADALSSRRRAAPRAARPTFAMWSYPTPGSPAGALLQVAGAVSEDGPVALVSPAGLRPRRAGAVTALPARLGRTLEWAGGPLIALVDSPEAAGAAVGPLADRDGTAVIWELDRALAAGPDPVRAVAAAAGRVVVGSELDAWRLRLAVGPA